MADLNNPSDTRGQLIAASKVNGTAVYNTAGEKLGSIYDVMLDKVSGKADYAIMSFGGFLGIGDRYHPLPWRALKYDPRQGGYVVDINRSRLEGAPSYATDDAATWDDPAYGREVDDYYGVPLRVLTICRWGSIPKPPHVGVVVPAAMPAWVGSNQTGASFLPSARATLLLGCSLYSGWPSGRHPGSPENEKALHDQSAVQHGRGIQSARRRNAGSNTCGQQERWPPI